MHCKNFSLISTNGSDYCLSPAYDLLAVCNRIEDNDELALPLTGSGVEDKGGIAGFGRTEFEEAMTTAGIDGKVCG